MSVQVLDESVERILWRWQVSITASLLIGYRWRELGGRQGSATAAGLIDTAGYLGAAFSGYAIGRLVDAGGWSAAFQALALVAGASAVAATVYGYRQHSKRSAAC